MTLLPGGGGGRGGGGGGGGADPATSLHSEWKYLQMFFMSQYKYIPSKSSI